MRDDRSIEAVSDAALDREIEHALAVNPSPEFLARVRTRVANEPAPGAWRVWWLAPVVVAAAVVAYAVVLSLPRGGDPTAELTSRPLSVGLMISLAEGRRAFPPAEVAETAPLRITGPTRLRFRRPAAVDISTKPAVLVSASESAALRRLLAGLSDGRIHLLDAGTLLPEAGKDLAPAPEITISPITIAPLGPVGQ